MELAMANGFDALATNRFEVLEEGELFDLVGGDALSEVCKFVTGTVVGVGVEKGILYAGTKVAWIATATAGPIGGLAVLLVSGVAGAVVANVLIQD